MENDEVLTRVNITIRADQKEFLGKRRFQLSRFVRRSLDKVIKELKTREEKEVK